MTALVVRADSRSLPLAANTVDLVVTSPPYFGLRSYQDGGEHYAGQVGDEATPAEFVAALLAVTVECVRVLKPSGSIWVNLGDKYAGSRMDGSNDNGSHGTMQTKHRALPAGSKQPSKASAGSVRTKSLIGLPWRYALACIDQLGLILRAEVVWSKPNGLPESVTDRVRRSHEQWFHFTKEPRYFSAVDEVREPHSPISQQVARDARRSGGYAQKAAAGSAADGSALQAGLRDLNPLGKLPGSVWSIPTQPLTVPASLGVDHFAAFPMEWPRRIIRGWSPSGICVECGEGRRPVVEKGASLTAHRQHNKYDGERGDGGRIQSVRGDEWNAWKAANPDRVVGESCACPTPDAPTRAAVVLDPFGGTGTTALVASALGRIGISCDLSHDYSRLARWRTTDPGQRAAAMQVEKPKPELPGQADLFGDVA